MNSCDDGGDYEDRAVRALASPRNWLVSSLLLLPGSYGALLWSWRFVCWYWVTAVAHASRWIGVPLTMTNAHSDTAWLGSPTLDVHWTGRYPGKVLLLCTACLSVAVACSSFVRKERWLPIAYIVRVLGSVQVVVCAYFLVSSYSFPYTAQEHLRAMFLTQAMTIKGVPIAMPLIYYALDFTLWQKALATLLIDVYFIALLPFFLTLHALVIFYGSLLFLPLCFFVLGAPLLLGLFLTLYSYCASWPGVSR